MQQQSIKTSIGILVLFSLLVTGALFLGKRQHEKILFPDVVSFENIDVEKVSSSKTYPGFEVNLVYPKTGISSIDTTVANSLDESVRFFMDDAGSERLPEEGPYTFDADFDMYTGAKTITFVYTLSEYVYGAHGNHTVKTFTFDVDGKLLTLEDVFIDVDVSLTAFAPRVIEKLKILLEDAFQETWATEGTLPLQTNYSSFYLTKEGIGFVFDPYQVAPYVSGIPKIEIPFSEQKELFKSTYTQ